MSGCDINDTVDISLALERLHVIGVISFNDIVSYVCVGMWKLQLRRVAREILRDGKLCDSAIK